MISRLKPRFRLAAVLPLLVLAGGCSEFLAVNENPNAPENARVDLRLPAVIAGFGHSVLYGSTQLWGAEWMQQFSFNRDTRPYSEIHRYELSAIDPNGPWGFAFSSVMNEAKNIVAETTSTQDHAYRGISRFIYAWSWAHVTDMWGPVPFTEAFDTRIPNPRYDDQKTVYTAVHAMLEEAISEMQQPSLRSPAANDLLFNGNMARWVKLARTVQARLHLRLAYAPGENTNQRAQAALASLQAGILSNAEDADFIYPGGQNGARNPLYTFQDLIMLVASEHFVELLKGLDDPRLPIMIAPAPASLPAIVYQGHRNGSPAGLDSTYSRIGSYYSGEARPLTWVSNADARFLEAEARLITEGAAAADAPYRAGIRAHMQKLGVQNAAIEQYVAARPSLATVARPLEEIMQQKYIANFLTVEPWNDYRRTGYPRMQTVPEAMLPGIPQRIRTPGSELSDNAHNVEATGVPTGLTGMMTKVWWATEGPR